ncbi:hypothetical protein SISSUDRAFT_981534 [Sistotremastrum suecicum HHB10207 ss-3]|nr:hypothetical protein SISSUDRAFT_981534 [Sistotremastrum suecicum HHB10207 ss-3]
MCRRTESRPSRCSTRSISYDYLPKPRLEYTDGPAPAPPPSVPEYSTQQTIEWLYDLFPPLVFHPDVTQRMITHASWNKGMEGHNARFSFLGRRVLKAYMMIFLTSHSDPATLEETDFHQLTEKLLDTYVLGEHVGSAWNLQYVMRWTPALSDKRLSTDRAGPGNRNRGRAVEIGEGITLRSSGLYKIRGATVEAVMGGIYHQFGGSTAHRIFHTHVLPHLTRHGLGLPEPFHEHVERLRLSMNELPPGKVAAPRPTSAPIPETTDPAQNEDDTQIDDVAYAATRTHIVEAEGVPPVLEIHGDAVRRPTRSAVTRPGLATLMTS